MPLGTASLRPAKCSVAVNCQCGAKSSRTCAWKAGMQALIAASVRTVQRLTRTISVIALASMNLLGIGAGWRDDADVDHRFLREVVDRDALRHAARFIKRWRFERETGAVLDRGLEQRHGVSPVCVDVVLDSPLARARQAGRENKTRPWHSASWPRAGPPGFRGPGGENSAVGDVGDHTHRKRGIDREHLFGIDADLALTGHDRPVDLVVILPRLDFRDIGNLVRLV